MRKSVLLIVLMGILLPNMLWSETLPKNIKWITNEKDPLFASPEAKKGGTFITYADSFPLTLRTVGPDSNHALRGLVLENYLPLTNFHPNTGNVIPALATHWAYDKDQKTVYYKLNPQAKWSDGKPITADDVLFTLEFMRSKHIVAPWYNNHYTENFDKVIKYDAHTIAVVSTKKRTPFELHEITGMYPFPKHAIQLNKDFVKNYNWKIVPNSGPYNISEIKKGKSITLKRDPNWWAKDLYYNKHRFNVDKILVKVIRDQNVAFEYFKKGLIDAYVLTPPDYWHDKSKDEPFQKGYIHKLWFYNNKPEPTYAMFLNMDKEIFKDKNARIGFAHAMNIEKILKTVLRGDYERLQTIYTGNGGFTNTKIKARKFDLNSVDQYLTKAGWGKRGADGIRVNSKGERFSVEVLTGYKHHEDRLVVLKEEAKKAGVELVIKILDGSTAFKAMLEKQHQVAWTGWSTSLIPGYRQGYHSENAHKPQTNNFCNIDNKKLDKTIETYRSTFDWKKKQKLSRDIQQIVYEEACVIPTFLTPYYRVAYWRYWRFPKVPATKISESLFHSTATSEFGDRGGLFWFDPELKKETDEARKSGMAFKPVTLVDKTFKRK